MRTLTRDEARERAALLDVRSYDLHLVLTRDDEGFASTSEVRFACRAPGATSFLELDGELLSLERDGVLVEAPEVVGNRLVLRDLAADNVVRVTARCATTRTGEGLHRSVDPADGEVYLYAQAFLDDAQRVFACFDQPDLKAVFRLTVDAPPTWTVLSNTTATLTGQRRVFAPTEPISTYLWTVAAGPWHGETSVHDGVRLGVWCRASLAPHLEADEVLAVTRACLDHQQEAFGRRYPFGDSYDQVFVPEFNAGAMENPGMVTFSDELFVFRGRVTTGRRRLRAQVVAHEMAHMWFGDLVTMRWWDDLWLNESFAEMLGVQTVDRATGFEGAWADFCLGRKAWGYRADQLPTTHPVAGDVADNRSALLNFDGISYAKGASALRQLAAWLGEDVFWAGVRDYLDVHAWGNTGLADLLAALERASGRDLQEWSRVWLRTSGVPVLRVQDGVLLQEADVQRPHRLGVGVYDMRGEALVRRDLLDVVVEGPRTPLAGVDADLVLPNDGDLTFAKVRLDARSTATVRTHLAGLDDPLARAVVWGSLWDAARDGELPAADLVTAVTAAVHVEVDPDVAETLRSRALSAATLYVTDGAPLRRALHEHALVSAHLHPAGSDLQLVAVRAAVDAAGPFEQALLAAWAAGTDLPPGVELDVDLVWQIARRRAACGLVGPADVDALLAQDRTSTGEQQAAWCHAALPGGKAAVWAELLGDDPVSNGRARALAGGFWQHGQDPGDWVERYAAEVPGLWGRRSDQLAGSATRLLFPTTVVEQRVLDLTAPLEATGPVGLRRAVLEQRDDLARALRARQAAAR